MTQPAEATAKAKDLTRMAVAKARLLEPLEASKVAVDKKCLVIGGGVAGNGSIRQNLPYLRLFHVYSRT